MIVTSTGSSSCSRWLLRKQWQEWTRGQSTPVSQTSTLTEDSQHIAPSQQPSKGRRKLRWWHTSYKVRWEKDWSPSIGWEAEEGGDTQATMKKQRRAFWSWWPSRSRQLGSFPLQSRPGAGRGDRRGHLQQRLDTVTASCARGTCSRRETGAWWSRHGSWSCPSVGWRFQSGENQRSCGSRPTPPASTNHWPRCRLTPWRPLHGLERDAGPRCRRRHSPVVLAALSTEFPYGRQLVNLECTGAQQPGP